jgi:hypothetical protein
MTNSIITVIRDPANSLGKRYDLGDDGRIVKSPAVRVSFAEAVQHHVPDIGAMEELLADVAENPRAAITNSVFPLVPPGEPFFLMSENRYAKLGVDRKDPNRAWPVPIKYDGRTLPGLGRFTEHTAPSSWILLDRDIDKYTPEHYANLSYDDWLLEVDKLLPGILKAARLRANSSSARITVDGGKPIGGGNGHTWLQVADPADLERMRCSILPRALTLGMAWKKPKISKRTGEPCASSLTTIIDPSVFVHGRLVFVGKPEVSDAIIF